jgi:hypothetical protein
MLSLDSYLCTFPTVQTHNTIRVLAVPITLLVAAGQLFRCNMSRLIFIYISNCSVTQYNNNISCNYSFLVATGQLFSYVKSGLIFMHNSNCSDTQHNKSISCNYSFIGSYWSAVQM